MRKTIPILLIITVLFSCKQAVRTPQIQQKSVDVPAFSADSAYKYIQHQVDFGPRVPNTQLHDNCAAYLSATLKRMGAKVIEQKADLLAFDGTKLRATNIIGSFNPNAASRVLLFSHWDSRPWADHDPTMANRKKPVMAANDGASGVGVLLEIARQLGKQQADIGIDIIFFDAEDYGAPQDFKGEKEDSWCLGTQYWAENPHIEGYTAKFGVLLDMVGAPEATFYKEQFSEYYAESVVNKVWSQAQSLGFNKYFIDKKGGGITDDHVYVNKIIGIPSIDIIHYNPNTDTGFGHYWHTVDDTMENIDKNTLQAVGTTLINVIYKE